MTRYAYRYLDDAGNPLKQCLACGHDLTGPDGVEVEFTDGRRAWDAPSRLAADGTLEDPAGMVAGGLHSETRCAACGDRLCDLDGVTEDWQGES